MKNYEILITSPPDRENLVAEIWHDNIMIAELNQEDKDNLKLEIYSNKETPISLDYLDFLDALQVAKEKLLD